MSKDRKSPFAAAQEEIDIRLGGLLGELGSALSEALSKLEDAGEVHRETVFDSGKGPVRASAGIRIRTLGGQRSAASERRTDKPVNTPAQTPAAEASPRPIAATILDDQSRWMLIADLPGIAQSDVAVQIDGPTLVVTAKANNRHYAGDFALPSHLLPETLAHHMQNGILEVSVDKDSAA